MTIQWGAWEYAEGGNGTTGMRVGIEVTNSAVSNTSSSVTFTFKTYTQNYLTHLGDSQVLTFGGVSPGSYSFGNASGTTAVLRTTRTYAYTYSGSSYGVSPGSVSHSATISGQFAGVTPTKSVVATIPARPFAAPTAPTGVVATRNSDAQATVSWTRTPTSSRPYTSLTVQMMTYTGSAWSGTWVTIAVTSATANSYVATSLLANRVYRFQVRSNNSVGSSSYISAPAYIYMTPGAPSSVVSLINPGGTTITTMWVNNSYVESNNTWTVERSVNGEAYASVVTGLAQGALSWVDSAPGAGSNTYRVKLTQSISSTSSAYATGNAVTTIVSPLAPSSLSPNGINTDLAQTQVLTWQHNPGGDGAPQSAFTIETSIDGGANWIVRANDVASAVGTWTMPASTLANGSSYLWRVRTIGITSGGYGPNSASSTITGSATPVVTLTAPPATTESLPLAVTWTYTQANESAQSQWWASLLAADGVTVLESQGAAGTSTSTMFAYPMSDGQTYIVQLQARSAAGLLSSVVSSVTTITLAPPAAVLISPEYQVCTGTVVLHVEGEAPLPGEATAESVTIERLAEGDDRWVTLVSGLIIPNDFIDVIPVTNGINSYRVTVVSAAPSYRVMDPVDVVGSDGQQDYGQGCNGLWVFLAYGPGFGQVLRTHSDLSISESGARTRLAQPFLGRKKPGLLLGTNTEYKVDLKATLHYGGFQTVDDDCRYDSEPNDWVEMGKSAELVCYRDYTGRRFFGMLSSVSAARHRWRILGDVSLSVTEIEYEEAYGQVFDLVDDDGVLFATYEIITDNGDGTLTAPAREV